MAKGATVTLYTTLGADEAASVACSALEASNRGVQFHPVTVDAIDASRFRNPIAKFATGKDGGFIKKLWGVQIEVYDEGDRRRVFLGAERSSHKEMAMAAWSGHNASERADALGDVSFNEKLGKEKIELVIASLKKADPRLTIA